VAMVVALFPVRGEGDDPALEASGLEELAKLGVTHAAFFRDAPVAGLVLEGWAFDARDAPKALRAVVGVREGVRMLQPLVQMAVSPVTAHNHRAEGDTTCARG
jgi:hypothetical protein